jgi:hypothetical protein
VDRANRLVLQPRGEWPVIDAEMHTVQGLYTQYVMVLAAIPPVSYFIGFSLLGGTLFGVSYRVPIASGIAHAITQYVLTLASVYVLAALIDALASSFGGTKNFVQAFKVAAFAPTAAWLAGIFDVIPALSILGVLGLYSLYVLFVGLPVLMKVPEDKALPYAAIVVIAAMALALIANVLAALMIPTSVRGF